MFQAIVRKLKGLVCRKKANSSARIVPFDLETFFDKEDPWYTEVYWAIYRFFANNIIFHPKSMFYELKWFVQRGRRGWADRDIWSLDYYIDGWMPDALRLLKARKHGVPCGMFKDVDLTKDGNPTEVGMAVAVQRWDAIMDKMIAAFEANRRIEEGLYEAELGAYPMGRPPGVSQDAWTKLRNDRFEASNVLMERDKEISKEGMALFIEHYTSLWD